MMRNNEPSESKTLQQTGNARKLYAEYYIREFDAYLEKRNSAFWLRDSFASFGAFFVRAGAFLLRCFSWGYYNYQYKTEKEKVNEYIEKKLKPALTSYANSEGTAQEMDERRENLFAKLDDGLFRFPLQVKEGNKKNKSAHKNYVYNLLLSAKKAIPKLLDLAYDIFSVISPYMTTSDVASVSRISTPARVIFNDELLLRKLVNYIVTGKQKEAEDMLKKAAPSLRLRLLTIKSIVPNESEIYNFTALQCALFFLEGEKRNKIKRMILKYLPQDSAELQRKELNDKFKALKEEVRVAEEKAQAAIEENRKLKATIRELEENDRINKERFKKTEASPLDNPIEPPGSVGGEEKALVSVTVVGLFPRETLSPQISNLDAQIPSSALIQKSPMPPQ